MYNGVKIRYLDVTVLRIGPGSPKGDHPHATRQTSTTQSTIIWVASSPKKGALHSGRLELGS